MKTAATIPHRWSLTGSTRPPRVRTATRSLTKITWWIAVLEPATPLYKG
ncbi:MAG: hypothetical protein NW224_26865 [Leptolyngbyaceae cyanobacterium bins.302]|nr:hypothetical protein [Leptolyngbyaceae cyanobacterium bins.302]